MRHRWRFMICLAGVLEAGLPSRADIVQTLEARFEGEMALAGGRIRVGGDAIPLGDVVSAIRETGGNTLSAPHAIRWKNGEVWYGRILGLESNSLSASSDVFGPCTIGAENLSGLDFLPRLDPGVSLRRGALYREAGEPIPGTLLWIRQQVLAIDCPLGVLTLPEQGTVRYVFPNSSDAPFAGADEEVGLIDGSMFRGQASLTDDGVELKHAVLGTISVPLSAVRYILRSPPRVMRLGLPAPVDVERRGFVGPAAGPHGMDYRRGGPAGQTGVSCLTAVRMHPETTVRYRLRGEAARTAVFHAVVAPVPGCRGDVRVELGVSGVRVYEQWLAATNEPVSVSLDLPAGDELTIKVDFGGRILYPCGVDWRDPFIVFRDGGSGE